MVDVTAYELSDHERMRLLHPSVGAVILFARNFQNRQQLNQLCDQIHSLRTPALPIFVDHEGGRVQRFRSDGFTVLPAMRQLGELLDNKGEGLALECAKATGFILASELRACGVDASFTPVLDLDYGRSEVIGNRAFHSCPEVVVKLAGALIEGLKQAGMLSCGKHFPGHGYVEADSHLAVPVDQRTFETIMQQDVLPYRELSHHLSAVMPAHVIYEQVDAQPAGFSAFWVKEVLRKQLNYDGVVFSDDLTMEGASVAGDISDRARAAFKAGCDMVLVCNHPEQADELLQNMPDGAVDTRRLNTLLPSKPALSWDDLQRDEYYVRSKQLLLENLFA